MAWEAKYVNECEDGKRCSIQKKNSLQKNDTATSMHFSWPSSVGMLFLSLSVSPFLSSIPPMHTHTHTRSKPHCHTCLLTSLNYLQKPQKPSVSLIHYLIQNGISLWAESGGKETLKWIKESRKWVNECREKLCKACNSAFSSLIIAALLQH